MEQMLPGLIGLFKSAAVEFFLAIVTGLLGLLTIQLRRSNDLTAVNGAMKRADGVALSTVSAATEGGAEDEGAAKQAAEDYLRENVGKAVKRLGGNVGAMAAAAAVGAIARAAAKQGPTA